jgi:soluble lytic murein transglycosylase-like protein
MLAKAKARFAPLGPAMPPALLLTALLLPAAAPADLYKYQDGSGHIYITDRTMGPGYRLLKRYKGMGGSSGTAALKRYRANRARYGPTVDGAAERLSLEPELLHAVVRAESAYDPDAVSSAGAVGLMQLMPDTARRYGVTDRRDPDANVLAGASYLRDLLAEFEHDLELALAAYNAGENAVRSYGNRIPPYPETQGYVRKVLRYYAENQATP